MQSKKAVRRRKRRKATRAEESGIPFRLYKVGDIYWCEAIIGGTRNRVTLKTTEASTADYNARQFIREKAKEKLFGVTTDKLTLGQLLAAYRRGKGASLEGQWGRSAESRAKSFAAVWGETLPVVSVSQSTVDEFSAARRKAWLAKHPEKPLRDGALDADFRWLSSVFNWATRHKLSDGRRLLQLNPLHDCEWPREKNIRRPVASQARYLALVEHTDTIDPSGRLRCILALARHTGRRESAIIQLRASDILLNQERIGAALAAAGMDVGDAEHMPFGGIRWRAESDKMGVQHITPISEAMRAELDMYLIASARRGDVPLFPAPEDATGSIGRSTVTKWLERAEVLAGVPKLIGGIWHPWRRLWATERQHLSDVSVAAGGGWKSTKTLKVYQQVDRKSVLAAILNH